MQALTLPTKRGWRWLADGFRIFRKSPLLLGVIVVGYWFLMAVVNAIPLLGPIVATLCIPAFSVSLMNVCRDVEHERAIAPLHLFSGFRSNLRPLLALGALYLGGVLAILGVSALADGGALMQMMISGKPPGEELLAGGNFLVATQIALLLLTPLMMAYWYAPVLAAWHDLPVGKALFFSFIACLRNWRAFFAYAVALMVFGALLPGLALGLLASLMPQSASFFTALFFMPLLLVLAPTLFASFYVSYRDVFVTIQDEA
ncbi:MAG: hypothetical protein BGO63_09350 [Candidatus Accumulibacter sp. 66-26]|nr:hypothetical protein [Accumulibacter sp.]OJW49466.1 MAG: hypothetical protein BGO63_09350 [Candidatus Accumulibacter sp. 66-26]